MKLQYLFICLIVLFLCLPNVLASTGKSKAIAEVIKKYNVTGDLLVAKGEKVIHKQSIGLANREWKIPH